MRWFGANNRILKYLVICVSCILFFLYFGILNRYHLSYLEQNQLFRYKTDYLSVFFHYPGGLIVLLDSFLTQFFYFPWIGAFLLTLVSLFITLVTNFIIRKIGLNGILFSILPLFLLAALHSYHIYRLSLTLGLLCTLSLLALFIKAGADKSRFWFGVTLFIVSYFLTGFFAFLTLALCLLYDLLYRKGRLRYYMLAAFLILAVAVPYMAWRFVYLLELRQAWLLPVPLTIPKPVMLLLVMLILYYPLLMMLKSITVKFIVHKEISFFWNWQTLIPGIFLYLISAFMVAGFAYDRNNELFLNIDNHYQSSSWKKILALSNQYPGKNQLVMYYTNLALYKNGEMADRMFAYRQSGNSGLWLEWKRNVTAPFYGGEVFYQLGYINEAFRWAFEAMEVKGLNPRSLKRLVNTSIINRHYEIAGKYLNYLDQTLFYRAWARAQRQLISDTILIQGQKELVEKRNLLLTKDFIADISTSNIGLDRLLIAHPDNRMAFEYMMASYLLTKNLEAFADNIYRLRYLGYKKIPQHYEEALILYAGLTKKDVVPAGYRISNTTRDNFYEYARSFAANRYSMDRAARALSREFGNTFWYYMQFVEVSRDQTGKKL